MKRILAIGIVLLVLLALTGVVSGATEGKADIYGDIYRTPQTIELTTQGGISNWELHDGSSNVKSGEVTVQVVNTGYLEGYSISVADKLDAAPGTTDYKPTGSQGHMVTYWNNNPWNWGTAKLDNPLNIDLYGQIVALSGIEQELYTTFHSSGVTDVYKPDFLQTVVPVDKPAKEDIVGFPGFPCDGYRIIVTFTATPN